MINYSAKYNLLGLFTIEGLSFVSRPAFSALSYDSYREEDSCED